jgi:hypothetical protein
MGIRIRNQQDVAAGAFYVIAGAGFSLGALNYKMGDPARMGPGWFPFWVGILLVLVGVLTAANGLRRTAEPDKLKRPDIPALAWILGGVVLFGILLQPLGLVLSLLVLVLVCMRASHEFNWRDALITAVALIVFSYVTFVWGIELQIGLWPAFLG